MSAVATNVTGFFFEAKPLWTGTIAAGGVASDSTGTIPLTAATDLDNGDAYIVRINRVDANGVKQDADETEVLIGELSGTNLINSTRGVEGTAAAWGAGTVVEILFTATHWNKLIDGLGVSHNADGTMITSLPLTTPKITTSINDANGNEVIKTPATTSAINEITVTNSAAGNAVSVAATGGDTNIDIEVKGKGSGGVKIGAGTVSVTDVLDEDDMTSDSAAKLATQQSIKAYVDTAISGVSANTDGWTTSADTWVYASASTFTITGVDRTSVYKPGTRLKFGQSGTKYAVVKSSSFSTDTTVTIHVNTDYTIANATITDPYYSYQLSPQGYPTSFAFTVTHTTAGGAYTNNPTTNLARYWVQGDIVHFSVTFTYHGTPGGSGASRITGLPANATVNAVSFTGANYSNGKGLSCYWDTSFSGVVLYLYDATSPITANNVIGVSGSYKY